MTGRQRGDLPTSYPARLPLGVSLQVMPLPEPPMPDTTHAPSITLQLQGLSCASCVQRVERKLSKVAGVRQVAVNLASQQAEIELASVDAGTAALLTEAVSQAGFETVVHRMPGHVEGLSCASCVQRAESALAKLPGVLRVSVNLASGDAEVESAWPLAPSEVAQAVSARGFQWTATPIPGQASPGAGADAAGDAESRFRPPGLLILGTLLTLPLVLPMLAMPLGLSWMLPASWQLALALPVQVLLGARFYRGAWRTLSHGGANMDVLVAMGTTAAFALSLWQGWQAMGHEGHEPHLYFESAAVILVLVQWGKFLEARAKAASLSALRALERLQPDTAQRWDRATHRYDTVPVAQLQPGDRIQIGAGQRIPADSMVLEGQSEADESLLTGESLPVTKAPGDTLTGGAINGSGLLVAEVVRTGTESTLARIVRLVSHAQTAKAPIQAQVDRVAGVFVPVVLVIALLTWAGHGLFGAAWGLGWEDGLLRAVAVLVMACPCALGLATPAAIIVSMGVAARHGLLVRDAQALEWAGQLKVVAFDKTGTLTEGRPRLVSVELPSPAAGGHQSLLAIASALQAGSSHPLAKAVREACPTSQEAEPKVSGLSTSPGRGVEGEVAGQRWRLGSHAWAQASLDRPDWQAGLPGTDPLCTYAWLLAQAADGHWQLMARLGFRDEIKPTAKATVEALKALGVQSWLLSGDRLEVVEHWGRALGISHIQGEVLPEHKADALAQARAGLSPDEKLGMVGDGLNDAPALAQADVGFAMGQGADVARETAAITLLRGDPLQVPLAIELARATRQRIRQNLFWAFAYNGLGIPLAALGGLSPVVAGAAMALSSVSVLANALRLQRWRPSAPTR